MNILVVNAGSTSLKIDLFTMPEERYLQAATAQRIGSEKAELRVGERSWSAPIVDHHAALGAILDPLLEGREVDAVGHRVVHGGETLHEPCVVDGRVEGEIEAAADLAPLHNPPQLDSIRACRRRFPDLPHVASFDTAFHATLPESAHLYGLPYELARRYRIRRYGFHGTSHRFVAAEAARFLDRSLADLRVVTCHLGGGSSVCAIAEGRSVDTSMGMTPLEGLLMATRAGDLDPAIVLFLQEHAGMSPPDVDRLLNEQCGLKGLSGVGPDMRDLLQRAAEGHDGAERAIAVFCYRVKKYIGAYAAALGGIDVLVFTAGIGENAAPIRERIVEGLGFLGLNIDPARNDGDRHDTRLVSPPEARAAILVVPTDEELQIARETLSLISHR